MNTSGINTKPVNEEAIKDVSTARQFASAPRTMTRPSVDRTMTRPAADRTIKRTA